MRLPALTPWRRAVRCLLRLACRVVIRALSHTQVYGREHLPAQGPALLVTNHLGDADVVLLLSTLPWCPEALASIDLLEYPAVYLLLQTYGVIWVHRGHADRAALRAALQALQEGRIVALAPEGRQTLIQGLMPGTQGAAYLALKSRAPVIPVGITGTYNWMVFPQLRRGRRPRFTVRFGPPFTLEPARGPLRTQLEEATHRIMQAIARLLPPEYRGVYAAP